MLTLLLKVKEFHWKKLCKHRSLPLTLTPSLLLTFGPYSCVSLSAGPTGVTVNRFWEMVWENEVHTIVMLTRCVEDGKVCWFCYVI